LAIYVGSLDNPLVGPDKRGVADNYYLTGPVTAARLFAVDPGEDEGGPRRYSPLGAVSLSLGGATGGGRVEGYRVVSLLLHGVSSVLLFLVLARVGIGPLWALLGGLLFAVHPVHAQALNLISSQGDILSGALTLGAILALLRSALPGRSPAVGRPQGSKVAVALFVAALFSSWLGIAFLLFALLLPLALRRDYWGRGQLAVMAAAAAVYAASALLVGGFDSLGLAEIPWGAASLWRGIGLALGLEGGMIFHPLEFGGLLPAGRLIGAVALVAALAALGVSLRTASRPAAVILSFCTAAVTAAFFSASRGGALLEPGLYLLIAALCSVAALGAHAAARSGRGRVPAAGAMVFLTGLAAVGAASRCSIWSQPERVWREVLASYPQNAVATRELAEYYRSRGRSDLAAELASPESGDPQSRAFSLNNEGVAMRDAGRLDLAARKFREAIGLWPDFRDAHFNLGVVYHAMGMRDSAAACFRRAAEIDPAYADARYNLGIVYSAMGATVRAEEEYREAIRIDPRHARAWANLGGLLAKRGEFEEAVKSLEKAVEIDPGLLRARFNLALAYEHVDVEAAKKEWRAYLDLAKRRGVPAARIREIEARVERL